VFQGFDLLDQSGRQQPAGVLVDVAAVDQCFAVELV
jgi:hypothetical protein